MQSSRPNIIYYVCHDLGKHLGCYGTPVESPHLDRFAANGVQFNKAFCNSPACSPSRACAYTGKYAHTNGMMGLANPGEWSLPESQKTVVDYFNDGGYETAHFGLQHERYLAKANRYQVEGSTLTYENWINCPDEFCENAIGKAIEYLESRTAQSKPFYLNIGSIEVHSSRWTDMLPRGSIQNRAALYGQAPADQVYIPPYTPDTPALRQVFGRFQGVIRHLDSQVQRLFDAVERLGLSENTLVIFTSDHGIANMRAKGWIYDRGVEISLLMHMPGTIGRGRQINELIQNIDIAPTLLDVAGIDVPQDMQGKSFWPLLTNKNYSPHEEIFIERNWHNDFDPMRAVRTHKYHYIRNPGDNPQKPWAPQDNPKMKQYYEFSFYGLWPEMTQARPYEELYDVEADPQEFNNCADDPAYAKIKNRLASQLEEWMQKTDDPVLQGPVPNRLNGWPKEIKATFQYK
jgi:arylsulfatase A-like enzyme